MLYCIERAQRTGYPVAIASLAAFGPPLDAGRRFDRFLGQGVEGIIRHRLRDAGALRRDGVTATCRWSDVGPAAPGSGWNRRHRQTMKGAFRGPRKYLLDCRPRHRVHYESVAGLYPV